jgi:hypothetical protein
VSANITAAGQGNFYQVTAPNLPTAGAERLTVTAASTDAFGLNPYIGVFNSANAPVPSTVINNGNGTFTVQLSGVAVGTLCYVEVSALAGATQNVGHYALSVEFDHDAATTFQQLATAAMTHSATVGYQSLSVTQSELTEFSLSASIGTSTVASAVRMSIYDQNNNQVFTTVGFAGQPLSTGYIFLESGINYTVRYNAATQTGAALPNLSWSLAAQALSNPLAIQAFDSTLNGTGAGVIVGSSSGGTLGSIPIVNPYSPPTT